MLPAASGVIDLTDEACACVRALVTYLPRFIEILSQIERRAVVSTVVELFITRLQNMSQSPSQVTMMPLPTSDVGNDQVEREEALIAYELTECL